MDGAVLGLMCLVAIVALAIFGFFSFRALRNNLRGRSEHKRLAEEGGYELLVDAPQDIQNVYGGDANGRPFAYRIIQDLHRTYNSDGPRNIHILKVQLLTPLDNKIFDGFKMITNAKLQGVPETFEEIWTTKPSADPLTKEAKQLMYAFAAEKAHSAGQLTGGRFKSSGRQVRKLSIMSRGDWGENVPKSLFPDAVALMTYDHPDATLELVEFQVLVDELTGLANQVDQ